MFFTSLPTRWWYLCAILLVALLVSTSHGETPAPLQCVVDLPVKDSKLLILRKEVISRCEQKDHCACLVLSAIHDLEGRSNDAKTLLQNLCNNSFVVGACHRLGLMQLAENDLLNAEKSLRLSCVESVSDSCEQLSQVSRLAAELTKALTMLTE
jgi:hypothetical protein